MLRAELLQILLESRLDVRDQPLARRAELLPRLLQPLALIVDRVLRVQPQVLDRLRLRLLIDMGDDVLREVDHPLELARREIEQQRDPRRRALHEPDVRDRRGQLDVAHPLPPHLAARHLDAALVADDPLVAHPLVLPAGALEILLRAEDLLAEEPVFLGLQGAVVDRLRLQHLAERPVADLLRRRERNAHRVEIADLKHGSLPLLRSRTG